MAKPETTKVFSTEKDPHHKTGASWETTPALAEQMVKRGLASTEAKEVKEKKKTEKA